MSRLREWLLKILLRKEVQTMAVVYATLIIKAREIYTSYTDQVESFGLDECWPDVTGSAGLFGGRANYSERHSGPHPAGAGADGFGWRVLQ